MFPNDGAPLATLFGTCYAELHGLQQSEVGIVDVLSQVRNFNQPIAEQIEAMRKQLKCLEFIESKKLPNYDQLEKLAQVNRNANAPYARFHSTFKSMWLSIHSNIPAKDIQALGQLFKELGAWIELQEEFSSDERPNLINSLNTGAQTVDVLNQVSSVVLRQKVELQYSSLELKTYEIATISASLLCSFASFGVIARVLLDQKTCETDIRTIYASYANTILSTKGVQYAELMLHQDLCSFAELVSTFFSHQFVLSTKLFAMTNDSRFVDNRVAMVDLFKSFAMLIPYIGVPTTLTLRSCLFSTEMKTFDSSHRFAQVTKQPAKEAYWPLMWLGVEDPAKLSAEQREKLLVDIPNPDAKLWVERALKIAAKFSSQ